MGESAQEEGSVLEFQHREIDSARDELRDLRRFLRQFTQDRDIIAKNSTKLYLRGVHDGMSWGVDTIESITQYDDYSQQYDPRRVPCETVSKKLTNAITEANNENWGNVLAQLELAIEAINEFETVEVQDDDE